MAKYQVRVKLKRPGNAQQEVTIDNVDADSDSEARSEGRSDAQAKYPDAEILGIVSVRRKS
jgi:hypothetical protein